ncbi:metallophosphoesterase [Actinomadura keratinilytica]|uniref:metallophosphoesterase n=1 Tax=Actinomadura keratinilytica TaxID=547461 RepID=UPI00360D09DA
MAIIAQLSDIHLAAGRDGAVDDASGPVRALRAAVSSLLALPARPDAVVLTGDLAHGGRPAEYERLHALLSPLPMAVYPLPGNHDDRDALRKAFSDHPAVAATGGEPQAPVQYAVDVADARLVCCDTSVPGKSHGSMDQERLAWLDRTLAERPDTPTVVATHHPRTRSASGSSTTCASPRPPSSPRSSRGTRRSCASSAGTCTAAPSGRWPGRSAPPAPAPTGSCSST